MYFFSLLMMISSLGCPSFCRGRLLLWDLAERTCTASQLADQRWSVSFFEPHAWWSYICLRKGCSDLRIRKRETLQVKATTRTTAQIYLSIHHQVSLYLSVSYTVRRSVYLSINQLLCVVYLSTPLMYLCMFDLSVSIPSIRNVVSLSLVFILLSLSFFFFLFLFSEIACWSCFLRMPCIACVFSYVQT